MLTKRFTLYFGLFYIAIGVLGFIPALKMPPSSEATSEAWLLNQGYGLLFGFFAVNTVMNLAHIILGSWALMIGNNTRATQVFLYSSAIILSSLSIFGLLPGARILWGIAPAYGHGIWVHGVTALIAWYTIYKQRGTKNSMIEREQDFDETKTVA